MLHTNGVTPCMCFASLHLRSCCWDRACCVALVCSLALLRYSLVTCTTVDLPILPLVDACFIFFAVAKKKKNAAIDILMCGFHCPCAYIGSKCSCAWYWQTVFQSYTSWHSHQQTARVPVAPHPPQLFIIVLILMSFPLFSFKSVQSPVF